jgi:hypothetical protein
MPENARHFRSMLQGYIVWHTSPFPMYYATLFEKTSATVTPPQRTHTYFNCCLSSEPPGGAVGWLPCRNYRSLCSAGSWLLTATASLCAVRRATSSVVLLVASVFYLTDNGHSFSYHLSFMRKEVVFLNHHHRYMPYGWHFQADCLMQHMKEKIDRR